MSSADETTTDSSTVVVVSTDANPQQPPPLTPTENLSLKLDNMNISSATFSIWPPTQRTRDAVINRLIETLCNPSVLSKRYGSIPHHEASSLATAIEAEAFTAAASSAAGESLSVDEGIEILQVYSKEISKRMLEAVKSRPATKNADIGIDTTTTTTTFSNTEDVSSSTLDNESSA